MDRQLLARWGAMPRLLLTRYVKDTPENVEKNDMIFMAGAATGWALSGGHIVYLPGLYLGFLLLRWAWYVHNPRVDHFDIFEALDDPGTYEDVVHRLRVRKELLPAWEWAQTNEWVHLINRVSFMLRRMVVQGHLNVSRGERDGRLALVYSRAYRP